jgi:sucrose-6-phosphate hydrolase SacC (GH32 family)
MNSLKSASRSCLAVCALVLANWLALPEAAAQTPQPAAGQTPAQSYPLYQEPWRPQFHFSQPNFFMNDPNGLVYYDGEWHLFYQYRPGGGVVWGHAVSRDLLRWENLPVAIPRQADGKSIFSGSTVIDRNNTSGLGSPGNPAMAAVYTAAGGGSQAQALAYSLDQGRTFQFYSGNPVLDIGESQFRDPKVFWHQPTNRWIMVVAMPNDHHVAIYGAPDLKQWTLLSKWGPLPPTGGQYEVPDLFPLPIDGNQRNTKWVMIISTNPGGLWGGSLTAAYIGDFDGTKFTEDSRYFYAGPSGMSTFDDFEGPDYGRWTPNGAAFGGRPQRPATTPGSRLNGFQGSGVATSIGATSTGTLASPPFQITRRFINFRVGGSAAAGAGGGGGGGAGAARPAGAQAGAAGAGAAPGAPAAAPPAAAPIPAPATPPPAQGPPPRVAANLVIDGTVVRTRTAVGGSTLDWTSWDVGEFLGRTARIELVDENPAPNSGISIDEIGFSDTRAIPGLERTPWLDWGKDNYAGITFDNAPDGRRLFVGWLNNWQYAQSNNVPTAQWWRGLQSEPRELSLRTVHGRPEIYQTPLRELETLRQPSPYELQAQLIEGTRVVPTTGKHLDIEVTLENLGANNFGLKVFVGANGEETVIGYDVQNAEIFIDRTKSGAAAASLTGFHGVHRAPLQLQNGRLDMRILVDNSVVEVFANNGERVLTDLVYSAGTSDGIALFAEGGTARLVSLKVHKMNSIWSQNSASPR